MPSIPPKPRYLSSSSLRSALSTSKPVILSDTLPPSSSRPPHRPLPSSASSASVKSIAWSPLGTLLAVADSRSLRVWQPDRPLIRFSTELKPPVNASAAKAANGRAAPVPQHLAGTEEVAWNPVKEGELASVGGDGIVRFWDIRTRGICAGEVKIGGEGLSMAWRPDGMVLVVVRKDDTLISISRTTLSVISEAQQDTRITNISFSNGGAELFIASSDSQVRIADYPSLTTLQTITPNTSTVTCCVQCPRGRHLGIGGSDALITLWDTGDMTCVHSIADITGPVRSISFSFDGCFVVGGSDERNEGAPGNVTPVAPSGPLNGSMTAELDSSVGESAPSTSGLSVYAVDSGECVYTIETAAATACVAWHPSRYLLAYSGETGGVKIIGEGGR